MKVRTVGEFISTSSGGYKDEGSTNNRVPMGENSMSEVSTDLKKVLSLRGRT